jgi:WD40 repeat protein
VSHIVLSPDGRRLASSHSDGTLKLWDLTTGAELRTFPGRQKALKSVAFSPNGKRLATAIWDGSASVWDIVSGQELRSFVADADGLNAIAFSPDGALIITAGLSRNAKLWDSESGREILTLVGPEDGLTAVAFAPSKESRVAVASRDNTVRIYELELERLKQRARQLIQLSPSPLTGQNCAAYPAVKPCPGIP